jgi:hypothetical protein
MKAYKEIVVKPDTLLNAAPDKGKVNFKILIGVFRCLVIRGQSEPQN